MDTVINPGATAHDPLNPPVPAPAPEEFDDDGPPHPWDWPTAIVLWSVHVGALAAPFTFSWSGLAVCLVLYAVTAMGVTLAYHRLLTHRSFKTPRWFEYLLTVAGAQACQGGPIGWVAVHRLHHGHSDRPGDPHGADKGFWWSHMGWMMSKPPHKLDPLMRTRMARDLEADAFHRWLDRGYILAAVGLGFLLLKLGGWSWVVWGMFVRLVLVYHATWLVNSAAHKFGYRSHRTNDLSTNCWWVALLTFGEGWHNNHHAYPASARHGLRFWEVDVSYMAIKLFERMGLVWDIKLAPEKAFRANPGDGAQPTLDNKRAAA
ncbi:MAG: fatty acid desaturase [Candidatus Eremiobacterota bacterium]